MAKSASELDDYLETEKLKLYEELMYRPTGNLFTYNVNRLMPDVKGKTVLDLPCGIGYYVRELFRLGAAKVIASDIVSRQLDLSKEKDRTAGLPDGFVEYHQHDAKIPKQIGGELADVCLALHLFCFAESEGDLRGMAQTVHANLKPGGSCLIVTCLLRSFSDDEQKLRKQLERVADVEDLIHVDPPTREIFKPRRYHTKKGGFNLNRYIK